MDLYLKFSDEAEAKTVLYEAVYPNWKPSLITDAALESILDGLPLDDAVWSQTVTHEGKLYMADAGKWYELVPGLDGYAPKFRNIDTIGVISKRTGGTDEEPVFTTVPGWHVNVRALDDEDVSGLEAFVTNPATPVRVWA